MKIERIREIGANKPACTYVIWAVAPDRRPGIECKGRSQFMVDGHPRCRNHAGHEALMAILEGRA